MPVFCFYSFFFSESADSNNNICWFNELSKVSCIRDLITITDYFPFGVWSLEIQEEILTAIFSHQICHFCLWPFRQRGGNFFKCFGRGSKPCFAFRDLWWWPPMGFVKWRSIPWWTGEKTEVILTGKLASVPCCGSWSFIKFVLFFS